MSIGLSVEEWMLSVVAKVNFVIRMGEARISRAWAGAHEQNNWYDSKDVKDREGGGLARPRSTC